MKILIKVPVPVKLPIGVRGLSFLLFMGYSVLSYGQGGMDGQGRMEAVRELSPIRGQYKVLAALSPRPKSPNEAIDKLKFPFDLAFADRVLSLKPFYLQNVSVGDFNLPDPPANSSEQT